MLLLTGDCGFFGILFVASGIVQLRARISPENGLVVSSSKKIILESFFDGLPLETSHKAKRPQLAGTVVAFMTKKANPKSAKKANVNMDQT